MLLPLLLLAALLALDPSCSDVHIDANPGARTVRKPVDFNHGRR